MKNLILLFIALIVTAPAAYASEKADSVFDTIEQTKTLRCGYLPYEPFIVVDPNSGEVSGLTHDYLDEVAKQNGFKVEWTQEVTFDQVVPAIEGKKIDAFCVPCTPDANFEKVLDFPGFLGALPYYIYVPENSDITDEKLKSAKFGTQDGYALTEITRVAFPDATFSSLAQTASAAEFYDQLKYAKVDAVVNENISAQNYMRNNEDIIRQYSDTPVIAMRMFLVTKKNDTKMSDFIDKTFNIDDPQNTALMKSLMEKYKVSDTSFLMGEQCANKVVTEKGSRICLITEQKGPQ